MGSSPRRFSNLPWDLIVPAAILLGLYSVMMWAHHNFALPDFNYLVNPLAFMANIPSQFVRSQFWKIMLLFPATILFSVAFAKAGFRFHLPSTFSERAILGAVGLIALIILIFSTQFLFRETEITDDENAYDFQARTLLLGRVVNPPPPVVKSFENVFIIDDGKQWVGKYTLGHPLIIALGMVLGDRYVLTIALSVLTLFLIYLVVLRLYGDKKIALLTLLLAFVSPFFYLVSSSRLSHTTTAFFLTLFIYLFLEARNSVGGNRKGAAYALLAGIALGYAFNVRSLTALAFAIPFSVVGISDLRRKRPGAVSKGLLCVLGFLVMLAMTLWYNAIVTGSPVKFPFHYYDIQESLGFGVQGHSVVGAFRNLAISLGRLNGTLLGFPLSLLFVFLALFSKKEFGDHLSLGILCSVTVLFLFYYSPGVPDLGPVYYYEAGIILLILSARGILFVHRYFSEHLHSGNALLPNFLAISVVLSMATFVPEQINHISRLTEQIRSPYEAVKSADVHHALVFIQAWPKKGWVFGFRNPSPAFTDDVFFAIYADSASNRELVNHFAERSPFVLRQGAPNAPLEVVPIDRTTLQPLPSQ